MRVDPQSPEFLRFYAGVMDTEAERRSHQPEFAAWLRRCADKARAEAQPRQRDLFNEAQQ